MDDLRTPLRRLDPADVPENENDEEAIPENLEELEKRVEAKTRIDDPATVLRLVFLEERMKRILVEKQTRPAWFEARVAQAIQQVQADRNKAMQRLSQEESENIAEIKMVKEFLAQKHGIDLSLYSYDEATGTLSLLPS
jgi:hypothetical protein